MLSQYKSSEISVLGHNQPSKLLYEKGIKRKIFADLEEYGFIMGFLIIGELHRLNDWFPAFLTEAKP